MADSVDDSEDPQRAADGDAVPRSDASDATPQSREGAVDAHTTDRRTLSPSVQGIWAVRVVLVVAVLSGIGFVAARRLNVDRALVAAGAAALLVLGLVWVHLRYRVWSFRVREDALYLERGVIRNVKTVAPHVRIQHVDTSRGPLERALGLSTLVVYTAGSRGADVSIPGLRTDEAADLQDRVKELAIAAEGGDAL